MNKLEYFFLDFGLSWSFSKAIPYLLCIFLGVLLLYFFKKITFKKKWLKIGLLTLVFTGPFALYFSFFPIYEGDFVSKGTTPKSTIQFPIKRSLTVVVLPNCPFCYQSIVLMKKIKERNPRITINYWVSTQDTLPAKTAILKVIPTEFKTIQRHDILEISDLVQGTYPCYILSEKGKVVKLWNNNQIGVSALDQIEDFLK
jgi:hypothetical protein